MGMGTGEAADEAARRAAEEAEAERQRLAAETRAARESGVMLRTGGDGASVAAAVASVAASSEVPPQMPAVAGPDVNGPATRAALVGRNHEDGDTSPPALPAPASPWTFHAGHLIAPGPPNR